MSESEKKTPNRLGIRSIETLKAALLEILQDKPFSKIKITEIVERSGLTRPTFYAHFDTKDDLLNCIINGVLDEFFDQIHRLEVEKLDLNFGLEINKNFFRIWKKNHKLLYLLENVDFECFMIAKMREFWDIYTETKFLVHRPVISKKFVAYTNNYLSYTYVAFLKEWIRQDLEPSEDIMGEMLFLYTGPETSSAAHKKFSDKIK